MRHNLLFVPVLALVVSACDCGGSEPDTVKPQIEVSPLSVDFGTIEKGNSAERSVTISNRGGAILTLSDVALAGDAPAHFSVEPLTNNAIAAGGSLTLRLGYAPSEVGGHAARLLIHSDAANTYEVLVTLGGTASEVDPCKGVTCDSPPVCFKGGQCVNGTCEYEPDPAAVETDAALCQRIGKNCGTVTEEDNCGTPRTVDCGSCTSPETCGGNGMSNVCGCAPEQDAAFCSRLGATCGSVTAPDNCGASRTATCGSCTSPETCGGGGVSNVCGCTQETDAAFCTRMGAACGNITGTDNCGGARTANCGPCGTCAAPEVLSPTGGVVGGSVSGTSAFGGTCGGSTAPEKVFSFTPQFSGATTVSTCGSNYDTVLEVQGAACSGTLYCQDNSSTWCGSGSTNHSLISFTANAGTTYYFLVDGAGTASGNYSLRVAAPGGTCAAPWPLSSGGGTFHYAFNGNSTDTASCGGNGADRVHSWTPTKSGTATVTMVGDFWSSVLYVRSGSCKGTQVACDFKSNQWPTNTVSFSVTAGTPYYIWVSHGSYQGSTIMNYNLTVAPPP